MNECGFGIRVDPGDGAGSVVASSVGIIERDLCFAIILSLYQGSYAGVAYPDPPKPQRAAAWYSSAVDGRSLLSLSNRSLRRTTSSLRGYGMARTAARASRWGGW